MENERKRESFVYFITWRSSKFHTFPTLLSNKARTRSAKNNRGLNFDSQVHKLVTRLNGLGFFEVGVDGGKTWNRYKIAFVPEVRVLRLLDVFDPIKTDENHRASA